jgi:hypothetical protein
MTDIFEYDKSVSVDANVFRAFSWIRKQGYAVAMWTPEEMELDPKHYLETDGYATFDPEDLEGAMITAGDEYITEMKRVLSIDPNYEEDDNED